eukprot:TRINITY_DN58660_c0_g1_i1.p1 TRINITY_DN58660_c0_g1~~TRINITY_DN58660_c0_g1_i1.p1  ORF type:complete len:421 (+),score=73.87 TRINITY_DN58660_c0_g1_i1:112-1374(+)
MPGSFQRAGESSRVSRLPSATAGGGSTVAAGAAADAAAAAALGAAHASPPPLPMSQLQLALARKRLRPARCWERAEEVEEGTVATARELYQRQERDRVSCGSKSVPAHASVQTGLPQHRVGAQNCVPDVAVPVPCEVVEESAEVVSSVNSLMMQSTMCHTGISDPEVLGTARHDCVPADSVSLPEGFSPAPQLPGAEPAAVTCSGISPAENANPPAASVDVSRLEPSLPEVTFGLAHLVWPPGGNDSDELASMSLRALPNDELVNRLAALLANSHELGRECDELFDMMLRVTPSGPSGVQLYSEQLEDVGQRLIDCFGVVAEATLDRIEATFDAVCAFEGAGRVEFRGYVATVLTQILGDLRDRPEEGEGVSSGSFEAFLSKGVFGLLCAVAPGGIQPPLQSSAALESPSAPTGFPASLL